ncbi:hypothetical protein DOTSEDRAFT_69282 [Dothistroma septosporum NZE10]|uniref:Zn(2)-C6 fungal-type domain-containing protein n=1 Tax=Dothistroma septosporum (strain NZE10 / CBS 128990) TaxID=675120 RepID=N1PY15_DOTSN|nr:hypothetical protein DOTSEDRAFT_69282 [Dothistroma septosporum NZE10]
MDDRAPNKRQKRRAVACERCNKQKIKCSGELPCDKCEVAKKSDTCRYPVRGRNVTVPESYLEALEREVSTLKATVSAGPLVMREASPAHQARYGINNHVADPDVANPLLDIQNGLFAGQQTSQPIFVGEAACTAFGDRLLECVDRSHTDISCNTMRDHVTHPVFDRLLRDDVALPNRVQATLLVRRADSIIGHNYHLFEKKSFYRKLDRAYTCREPTDFIWTCHFFAVLALGELYSNCKMTSGDNGVPGTSWFVKAVSLLQDIYEVATVEQVQILLLLSFYANALGRVKTAHVYCGIALRLAISLGLHRSQAGASTMDSVQRESRRRTWWTLYLFDRMIASKLGYPLSIRDEDIDVEMPSMNMLSDEEQAEFSDPVPLRAHAGLARITGCTLSDIDSIPKHQKETFSRRVYRVLNDLRRWDAELPDSLRLRGDMPPRNLFTLHMHYHLCIIQSTRLILLYLFKAKFRTSGGSEAAHQSFSPLTLALADACVQSARTTNQLLSKLFIEGNLAVFGYFDAHYLFSSTLILVISACMSPAASTSEGVATALSLLKAMADNGNISARDYLGRLEHIRSKVSHVRSGVEVIEGRIFSPSPHGDMSSNSAQALDGTGIPVKRAAEALNSGDAMPSGDDYLHDDPLGNPFIESFLADKAFLWPDGPSPAQDIFRQFAHELEDEFSFGA